MFSDYSWVFLVARRSPLALGGQEIEMNMQNGVIEYRTALAPNREVFLLNFREEFQAFSETDALLHRMAGLLATAHAEARYMHSKGRV